SDGGVVSDELARNRGAGPTECEHRRRASCRAQQVIQRVPVYHSPSTARPMTMRKTIPTLLLAGASVFTLGACHAIYRPDVQQGNLLIGKNVSELKPGLTKQQVVALLGSPSVVSPFNANQWNYVATMQRRGGTVQERTLTLYFDNDTLVRTDGNFMKETPQELLQ